MIIEPHLGFNGLGGRDPMQGGFDLAAVRGIVAAAGLGIIGATQFNDFTRIIFDDVGAFDEIAIKELLEIPESKKIVVCMTFGKPRGRHVSRSRKDVESFVYLDRFGNNWNCK